MRDVELGSEIECSCLVSFQDLNFLVSILFLSNLKSFFFSFRVNVFFNHIYTVLNTETTITYNGGYTLCFWFEVYPNNHLICFEQCGEEALQQYATNVEKLDEACLQVNVTGYIT